MRQRVSAIMSRVLLESEEAFSSGGTAAKRRFVRLMITLSMSRSQRIENAFHLIPTILHNSLTSTISFFHWRRAICFSCTGSVRARLCTILLQPAIAVILRSAFPASLPENADAASPRQEGVLPVSCV